MSTKRKRLSDLVDEENSKVPEGTELPSSVRELEPLPINITVVPTVQNIDPTPTNTDDMVTNLQSLQTTDKQSTVLPDAVTNNVREEEIPKYLRLERKEARLRVDQVDQLSTLARQLSRAKKGQTTERITDNTLIRIAVDLLLREAYRLEGKTEEELRKSLSL